MTDGGRPPGPEGTDEGAGHRPSAALGLWLPIGVALGISLGQLSGNLGLGLALGIGCGVAVGAGAEARERRKAAGPDA
ncbi:hypothetical protein ACFC5H_27295 [Streptomyces rochei]|uniref:hypothetical protein n=1 Tax=Streptomyces TaxID=1883 RepID=UPI003412CD86